MNNIRKYAIMLSAIAAAAVTSCRKDDPDLVPGPAVPPTEDTEFEISRTEFILGADGTPVEFTITSPDDWEISVPKDAPWIGVSPMQGGPGETTVTITPAPITDRTPRSRKFLTISYGNDFIMITVSQDLPNGIPTAARPAYPAQDAEDMKINVEFTWGPATDPDDDPVSYTLMISKDNGSTWQSTSTTSTRAKFDRLLEKNTEYSWKVVAEDNMGGSKESETYTFTTGDGGAYKDGEVTQIQQEKAGAPKPVHLVFTGDGFIEEDYVEGGAFDQAVETAVNAFFSVEPYPTYRDYFRISTVAAHSQERGATVRAAMADCPAQTRNTIFKSEFYGGSSTNIECDYDKVFSYALKVPGMDTEALENTTVIVIINLNAYAGTCMMNRSGRSVSMCPIGKSSFEKVVSHEAGGHGFGRLLDEYQYHDTVLPTDSGDLVKDWRSADPYYGYNISLTGNRDEVHWKGYFSRAGYEAVGMYEGAYLYKKGVWRPEQISCMKDNRPYYNAPSREAIVRRIMKASGKTFDIENFINKDVTEAPASADVKSLMEDNRPFGAPVLIDDM